MIILLEVMTIQEKAAEWNVSVRHVQYLCKKGRIKGAVKRAGTWFIPNNTPPIESRKSDDRHFRFSGTKRKIFEHSIKMFMTNGFDATSMKDIAAEVGIAQSAIYNHFKTKQVILDTIYDFYIYQNRQMRPSIDDVEPILHSGNLMDIMTCVWYEFTEYKQEIIDIIKIIFQRNSIDERAREITKSILTDENIEYVEAVFNRAVEIGRLSPMDTHAMSVFINSIRRITLDIWIIDPSHETNERVTKEEMKLYGYASKLLTDLKP